MLPLEHSILNVPGFELEEISGRDPVVLKIRYLQTPSCRYCYSWNLRVKDTFYRWIRHESLGNRKVYLYLKTHKYLCNSCGKYFNDRFPGILPYKRSTEAFRKEVFQKHNDGICQKTLSNRLGIAQATIERWYHSLLELKLSRRQNNPCPRVLGIDEHFFTRKQGYATTLCDLGNHKIYDVVLGRSEKALEPAFQQLPDKRKVRVVVMDLSETYRCIARKYFPNAKIVADRFHVIRLVNHHFLKLWQSIDPQGRKNRGLLSLMRRHEANLQPLQRLKLQDYFTKFPALAPIWEFKQKLCRLLLIKRRTRKQCKRLIRIFLAYLHQLQQSKFESMITLANTLEAWQKEIVRMWRFTKSNGITEGFHTKMELINRRAYGFRNFQNYRLRALRALCASTFREELNVLLRKCQSFMCLNLLPKLLRTSIAPFFEEEPRAQMGSAKLPATQHFESRIFKYSQPFYSKYQQRRQQFVFGERSKDLGEVETIDQRVWEKHQTHLQRLENFPLKKAMYYRNLQESTGTKSVRGLSDITGEDWSYIARILKTLELPESIQNFLNQNQHPAIVKHFHLRLLLELVHLPQDAQIQRFHEMRGEVEWA